MYQDALSEIFSTDVLTSRELVRRDTGHDILSSSGIWERMTAEVLGGTTTPVQCPWDVEVEILGRSCRVEVKVSFAFPAIFSPIRGVDCCRNVFKWAGLRQDRADAFLLFGVDVDDAVTTLLLAPSNIQGVSSSLTVTAPSSAKAIARMEWASIPFAAILPAVAAACHNAYDAPMRRKGIVERKPLPLFDEAPE